MTQKSFQNPDVIFIGAANNQTKVKTVSAAQKNSKTTMSYDVIEDTPDETNVLPCFQVRAKVGPRIARPRLESRLSAYGKAAPAALSLDEKELAVDMAWRYASRAVRHAATYYKNSVKPPHPA